jgi:hypothetical protein
MTWIENVQQWRRLPAEEKLLRRWRAIPRDVAQSMAFEQEPVDQAMLEGQLARIGPPATLKHPRESSPIPK